MPALSTYPTGVVSIPTFSSSRARGRPRLTVSKPVRRVYLTSKAGPVETLRDDVLSSIQRSSYSTISATIAERDSRRVGRALE